MPLITYQTSCTKKLSIARGVYELRFTKPSGFSFVPGQFLLLDVPSVDHPEDLQPRALSIASLPEDDDLLLLIKIVPGGRLGRWIEEKLHEGMTMTFKGPFGNFTLAKPLRERLLFIATGAGMAPFRPMLLQALVSGSTIDLVFGVRSEEDLFWMEWLESLSRRYPRFSFSVALTKPSPGWRGQSGRVQAVAPQIKRHDFSDTTLFVCGNPDMTTDVKRLALGDWGMEKKDVHVEGYI